MAAKVTYLGDGTLKLGTTPVDFSGEVLGAKITHEYNEIGEARTMLDGTVRPASVQRQDGLTASIENDLTAAGLYDFLYTNDLTEQALEFTPNTANGAKWVGTIQARLPGEVGSDEYGSPIVSDVELPGVGVFTFTPGT